MIELLAVLFCFAVFAFLLLGVVIVLIRLSNGPRTVNPYVPNPVAHPTSRADAPPPPQPAGPEAQPAAALTESLGIDHYSAFDQLLVRWAYEGRLSPAMVEQVRSALTAHVQTVLPGAVWQRSPGLAPAAQPVPAQPMVPAEPQLNPDDLVAAVPPREPPPPRRSAVAALGAALLSLDTRRVLLFLGAFLLVMSSLTLVIFNWNSLPALGQLAILAGTVAALWASGAWMGRRPELATAGRNLQAVAALLVPVVGFALGRPGLLDLAPRPGWLLASVVSLVAYVVAAGRTRRAFYAGAAAGAALSALLAAMGAFPEAWQPVPGLVLLAAMLPLSHRLRTVAPGLAAGPRWVALVSAPVLLLSTTLLYVDGGSGYALAAALFAGAGFSGLAYVTGGRRPWLWAALALLPLGPVMALLEARAESATIGLALGLFALAYLALSGSATNRHRPAAPPLLILAVALGVLTLWWTFSNISSIRIGTPTLIALGLLAFGMAEFGGLSWLGRVRVKFAATGLAVAGVLLMGWLSAMLDLLPFGAENAVLAMLVVPALAFVAAAGWPGRRHPTYDRVLQGVALFAALWFVGQLAYLWTLGDYNRPILGVVLLALVFGGQAAARHSWHWATAALGCGVVAAFLATITYPPPSEQDRVFTLVLLAFAALYSLVGAGLRRTSLRVWSWPAVGWGTLTGGAAVLVALLLLDARPGLAAGTLLALAALLGAHTALWRRPMLGYAAAPLLALAAYQGAARLLPAGWLPSPSDMAYVLCAIAIGLALIGQGLRLAKRAYARPYELLAFLLLPLAPLLAGESGRHQALTWAILALCYTVACWRYRAPWAVALAFVAGDMALLHGASLIWPGGEPARAGLLLAAAVGLQTLICVGLRVRGAAGASRLWGYGGAGLGGLLALGLAVSDSGYGAGVALALAALLTLVAWVEERELAAWGAYGLAVLALVFGGDWLGLQSEWIAAWLVLAQVGLALLGWAATAAGASLWRRPTLYGPLATAVIAAPLTLVLGGELPPLTLALASLGLLLATTAVRERELGYAYVAGGAFVVAVLSQLADWGFREIQWYAVPAGLYLLALAAGLRHFQGQRRASQVVETAAVVLLLGVTFAQAVRPEGGLFYSLLLFAEALVMLAYGALLRLRVPFLGGAAFFVAGVAWMTVDNVRLANQWLLLGAVGLLLVAAYVVLERHQERLVRAGRHWAAELRTWG